MSRSRPKKAISYARSAGKDPDRIARQHATNRSAAEADGHSIVEEVADDGSSGSTLLRPGMGSLLSRAARGELVGRRIYVLDRTRLSRASDPALPHAVIGVFRGLGAQVVFTSDPAASHSGDLVAVSVEPASSDERRARVRRVREGIARRREKLAGRDTTD